MEDIGIGAGLGALGFWLFIAAIVAVGVWDSIRKRDAQHETLRRCCGDKELADDLAQQVFLQAWRKISQLRKADGFGPWLNRLAITVWLQHVRKKDILNQADEYEEDNMPQSDGKELTLDLDQALASLAAPVRLCVVLSYQEGMTHDEIANLTELPPGTVKSHIRRGAQRLQTFLSAYLDFQDAPDVATAETSEDSQ